MGTALTGLLQGFATTKLALDERDEKRQKEQQEFELKKQDLDLKRKILQGEQASRTLQDQMHALNIQKFIEDYQKRLSGNAVVNPDAAQVPLGPVPMVPPAQLPAAPDQGLATVEPNLGDPSQPARLVFPESGAGALTQTPLGPAAGAGLTPIQRLIVLKAKEKGIDPAIALAQMHQESGGTFDNSITGKAGEIGLGQMLPSTGKELGYTPDQLRDPLRNIDATLTYLKQHQDTYGGDVDKALARYNGGGDPNYVANVRRWLPQYQAALGTPGADPSQLVAGPAAPPPPVAHPAPTPPPLGTPGPPMPGPPTAPTPQTAPPPGQASMVGATRLSPEQVALAQAGNADRRALTEAQQAITFLEAQRADLQTRAARAGAKEAGSYKQTIDEQNHRLSELTKRRGELEERTRPKTDEDYYFLSTVGVLPKEAQAIPGLYEQTHAAFGAADVTTKERAKDTYKLTQPLIEADPKHDYVDLATGQKVNQAMTYGEAQGLIKDGKVKAFAPLSGEQGKAWGYGSRMVQANDILTRLEAQGENGTSLAPIVAAQADKIGAAVGTVIGGAIGLGAGAVTEPGALVTTAGGAVGKATILGAAGTVLARPLANLLRTPQEQQYYQAKMDFMAAVLRKESGAAISASEYRDADERYFPQPSDGKDVMAQKAIARTQELKTLEKEAGERPLLTPQPVALAQKPAAPAPITPAMGGPQGPQNEQVLAPPAPGPGRTLGALKPEEIAKLPQKELNTLVQQADLAQLTPEQKAMLLLRYPATK